MRRSERCTPCQPRAHRCVFARVGSRGDLVQHARKHVDGAQNVAAGQPFPPHHLLDGMCPPEVSAQPQELVERRRMLLSRETSYQIHLKERTRVSHSYPPALGWYLTHLDRQAQRIQHKQPNGKLTKKSADARQQMPNTCTLSSTHGQRNTLASGMFFTYSYSRRDK